MANIIKIILSDSGSVDVGRKHAERGIQIVRKVTLQLHGMHLNHWAAGHPQ